MLGLIILWSNKSSMIFSNRSFPRMTTAEEKIEWYSCFWIADALNFDQIYSQSKKTWYTKNESLNCFSYSKEIFGLILYLSTIRCSWNVNMHNLFNVINFVFRHISISCINSQAKRRECIFSRNHRHYYRLIFYNKQINLARPIL